MSFERGTRESYNHTYGKKKIAHRENMLRLRQQPQQLPDNDQVDELSSLNQVPAYPRAEIKVLTRKTIVKVYKDPQTLLIFPLENFEE